MLHFESIIVILTINNLFADNKILLQIVKFYSINQLNEKVLNVNM